MSRLARATVSWIILLVSLSVRAASAEPDLVVQKTDITVNKSSAGDVTYVGVTVRNIGSTAGGPFTLRVGASKSGASSTVDLAVAGLGAGQSVVRTGNFRGRRGCAAGATRTPRRRRRTGEANNCAKPERLLDRDGARKHARGNDRIVNPGLETEQVLLTLTGPAGWIVSVVPTQMTLAPEELRKRGGPFSRAAGLRRSDDGPALLRVSRRDTRLDGMGFPSRDGGPGGIDDMGGGQGPLRGVVPRFAEYRRPAGVSPSRAEYETRDDKSRRITFPKRGENEPWKDSIIRAPMPEHFVRGQRIPGDGRDVHQTSSTFRRSDSPR